MFFLFALALSETQRCTEYFCYTQKEGTKELELVGVAEDFFFSWYGMMNSKPLSLDPNFGDGTTLTSINFKFPPSYYSIKLQIPNTVKFIRSEAFMGLERVSINLTLGDDAVVEDHAFDSCTHLRSVTFIGNAKKIGAYAFKDCYALQQISEIRAAEISDHAFYNCQCISGALKLGSVTQTIGEEAFSNCYLLTGDLTIPDSVTLVGKSAFSECKGLNGSLTLKTSISSIQENAFAGTAFTKVFYPEQINENTLATLGLPQNIAVVKPLQFNMRKLSINGDSETSKNKLSTGAIVGIAFAVLAVAALIIFAVVFTVKKVKAQKNYQEV